MQFTKEAVWWVLHTSVPQKVCATSAYKSPCKSQSSGCNASHVLTQTSVTNGCTTAWWQALEWLPLMALHALYNGMNESLCRGMYDIAGLFVVNSSWWLKKCKCTMHHLGQTQRHFHFVSKIAVIVTSSKSIVKHGVIKHVCLEESRQSPNPVLCHDCSVPDEPCLSGNLNNVDCCVCGCVYRHLNTGKHLTDIYSHLSI